MARHNTGQTCNKAGSYKFDGYTDGTKMPEPTEEEKVIPLDLGDEFPPVKSAEKGAYWVFIG